MAEQPTNGTEAAKVVDLHAMRDRGRAAFAAAFQEGGELAEPAKPANEAAAPAEKKPEPVAPVVAKATEPVDDFADDDAPVDEFADEPSDKAVDPETRRRLERLQQSEAKGREQLARDRAEFEREKAQFAERLAKSERSSSRTKYDAMEILEELQLDEDDWSLISRRAHARTKEGKADPKWREAVERESYGKKTGDDVRSLKAELAEMKAKLEQRDQADLTEKQLSRYFDSALKAAGDDSPLFSLHLKADPDEARGDLAAIAHEGLQKTGKLLPEKKLLKIYESRRSRFLTKFGVDVDALLGRKTKEQTLAAAKDHAAATNSTTANQAAGAAPGDRKAGKAKFLSSDVA